MERGIVWNCDKTYDIREFAELFYDRLPLIARIDELNDDDDIRSNSQSVCLVHSVHLQPRIITRTEQNDGQFVTFPYSYPFRFHVVQNDGWISEPLTVKEILQNHRQNLKGTNIRMAHREELTLSETVVTCDIFGTLVICGTYNEKYLLVVRLTPEGSAVSNDIRLTALPTYMPLIITLPAVALDDRLQKNLDEYQRDLKALTSAASYEENTEELLIFSHPPEDDEYELIFPSMLLTVSDNNYDKRKSSRELFTTEHNEASPTKRAQDNEYSQQLSEINSRGSEKRADNQDTTASEKCSLPAEADVILPVEAEVVYEDLPRCSAYQSSDTPGVEDNSDKGDDEHVYESYTEIPGSLSAEEVSERPPPLPVKQLVGRSSAKLCQELKLGKEPATVDNSSDRLVTGQPTLRENASDRPSIHQPRELRVPSTPPLLPGRPSLKIAKSPKSTVASERPSEEPLDQNIKTYKSPWYRFRPFRRRSSEKGKTMTGSRASSGAASAENKSPDNYLPTELNFGKVASTELNQHQPLRKSTSSDRPYDKIWTTSRRWKTTEVPQTPPVATDSTNPEFPMPGELTASEIRSSKNYFLRTDKRTAVSNRNQTKSKVTSKNPIRLEDSRNIHVGRVMKETLSSCDSKATAPVASLDASKLRPNFDRDSGFSCDESFSYSGNPRASLTSDSPMISNRDRTVVVFSTLSDVPKDISQLTVSGVTSCLRLLNLSQYIHLFHDQDVDGDLLACLDLDILMQDFGLKRFDALKLTKFVRDGWRPRIEPDNL